METSLDKLESQTKKLEDVVDGMEKEKTSRRAKMAALQMSKVTNVNIEEGEDLRTKQDALEK